MNPSQCMCGDTQCPSCGAAQGTLERTQAPVVSAFRQEAFTAALKEVGRLERKNRTLIAALENIHDIAQDNYDGPEDTSWGPVLSECQDALGIYP